MHFTKTTTVTMETTSSKLRPKLVKDGFEYTILRKNMNDIRWKLRAIQLDECGNRLQKRQKSCTADNNKLFNLCNQHQRKELTNIEFLNSVYFTCSF